MPGEVQGEGVLASRGPLYARAAIMPNRFATCPATCLAILLTAARVLAGSTPTASSTRTFRFTYASTLTGLVSGQLAQVWIPVATNSPEQQVQLLAPHLPGPWQINDEPKFHNRIICFVAPGDASGSIRLSVDYQVTRRAAGPQAPPDDAPALSAQYLLPDRNVPVGGKSLALLDGKRLPDDPVQRARVLYDTVDDDLQYRKDKPGWGRGDSDWVCDSRFGNCTDFHSLFISLARAQHLPARFEIGFAVPVAAHGIVAVPGYHCWAWYLPPQGGWTPVDIALANQHPAQRDFYFGHLDADRVAFTTGRDITLAPPQSGPPLNFFIYPYAEVDGHPVPASKLTNHFTASDD